MHIVFVMTQSLNSPSGLGRYGPIARQLAGLGHEIEVIALHPNWQQVKPKSFHDRGVKVRYVGQMHVRKIGPRKIYYSPVKLMAVSLASTLRLARALVQSKAEIIQLCKAQPYNVLAARIAGKGRPVYCDCDDYEAETNRFSGSWQKRIVSYFEDGIVDHIRGLTTNTRFTQARYTALGFQQERIVYVPNGVERERFESTKDIDQLKRRLDPDDRIRWGDPIIAYAGTLGLASHPVDLLLEAFAEVQRFVPAAQLLLIGGGEDYDQLRTTAQQLTIGEKTFFTGRVPPEEMPGTYALATVTVDPVHDDLTARARSPLKVVESLACGTPVITASVGDRREMLHGGQLGLLVSAGDAQGLARGIVQLLTNAQQRATMSARALAFRDEWYWHRLVRDFVTVYRY
ncbi:MAG: glycosyltransferase family 4 protein [Candidatus Promineifilaceae bacterium]|nr:glycosyltransferase family 4 protein [Candidatus Promineifilaceae bacterium]